MHRYPVTKITNLEAWGHAKVRALNDNLAEAMEDIAEEGQQLVHEYISTRGTANPEYGGKTAWKKTYRGKSGPSQGRVNTGQMRADIESRFIRTSDVFIGSFGWLDHFEDYYGLQEVGFEHEGTGEHIAGMFAMADAKDIMFERAKKRLNRVVHEF